MALKAVRTTGHIRPGHISPGPRTRLHGVLAFAGVCGLLLAACTVAQPRQTAVPAPAAAGTAPADVSPELAPYYRQRIDWQPCAAAS